MSSTAPANESTDAPLVQRLINTRIAVYGSVFIALIIVGAYIFSAYENDILGWMQANQEMLKAYMDTHPIWGALAFTIVFALVLGFYIPGGIVMMLMVGAIFPLWEANLIANTGNLLGATIGFIISRHLLRDEVQCCYGNKLQRVNNGIKANGWIYLLILRIAPVLPSPVVNLGMGLTPMRLRTYMLATLVGRLPMTALYVNLGQELSEIEHLSDLLSAEIIGSLILVGALMYGCHFALMRCEQKRKNTQTPKCAEKC
ncbi:MAG: TVP38/TMEM64 family protein [Alphaproteobacteria bacterium]|nr:TVP38/TMEM64 family protein [Alphaproteobacteria bacterium]